MSDDMKKIVRRTEAILKLLHGAVERADREQAEIRREQAELVRRIERFEQLNRAASEPLSHEWERTITHCAPARLQ